MRKIAYIEPLVAMKIAEFYPNRIVLIPIEDDELDRWSAAIYKLADDGESYEETLFELGHYENQSREGAIAELQFVLQRAMQTITTMSN